jgi:neutral ceramidase
MQAGTAAAVITPPLGIDQTGFAGRPGPSDRVHDDLYARAVVLEDGERRVALVALDLLGLAPELVERIRQLVAGQAGIPAEGLLLNCSHTHAGPATMTLRGLGVRDPVYEDVLARSIAGVVAMAAGRLVPARIAWGKGQATVGINRRQSRDGRMVIGENPGGAYDPDVPVLRVDGPDGRPLAVLFSHATHPVILGAENTGLSADLPGPAVSLIRVARVGGSEEILALFLQACCGNINPIRRGDLESVRSLGTILGAGAIQGAEEAQALEGTPIRAVRERLELPLQPPTSVEEARALRDAEAERVRKAEERFGADAEHRAAEWVGPPPPGADRSAPPLATEYALRPSRAMLAWAEDHLRLAEHPEPRTVPLEVQAIRIGDLGIVAIGAEVFLEIGRSIAARSPAPRTLVLGYSNGLIGYLPTAAAFPYGGYEVDGAHKWFGTLMVTSDAERLTTEAAERLLATLFR